MKLRRSHETANLVVIIFVNSQESAHRLRSLDAWKQQDPKQPCRAAAPLSLVGRYRRSQRKAPRNYRRIAALVAPCTFAHFADQMAGTDES